MRKIALKGVPTELQRMKALEPPARLRLDCA